MLNQLYKLLDNRFPAKSVAYPPTRYFNFDFTNKVSHHTSPEGRKGSPSTPHDVFVRHVPNYHSAPTTPATDAVASQISVAGGEIVDGDGSRTLKYNLPSLSSGPRRSSFRRAAYRPKQPIDVKQPQSCTDTVTLNPSNLPLNKKLVPILKNSSSYCSNKENENSRTDSDTLAPRRKHPSRLKRDQKDGGSNAQHTIASSLVRKLARFTASQTSGGVVGNGGGRKKRCDGIGQAGKGPIGAWVDHHGPGPVDRHVPCHAW
ncbi:unnamed protein product [Dibothriocephalus latus]|uniref:Uncharacterized protein n=1 Tax=Dibothriocephalus latus TaxID=60516 RepID=A0A3P7MMW5_DIBLA|nr:unnamed protein product [Dibothriocephalus latus]